MNNPIEIKEAQFVETNTINRVGIYITQVILNTSCIVNYTLYNTNTPIKTGSMTIEGQDYQGWKGNNDNYLEDLVLTKLGYSRV